MWLRDREESRMVSRFPAWATDEQNRFGGKNQFSFGHVELEVVLDNQVKISSWQLKIGLT